MSGHRTPRSTSAAITMLERFATIESMIEATETARNAAIARANTDADSQLEPLLLERAVIREKLEPWWTANAADLTGGKRKSTVLGGCTVGTKAGRFSLGVKDEDRAKADLQGLRWAKALLRVTTSLDRKAILTALDGKRAAELKALGFTRQGGEPVFVVERVAQGGTLAGATS